MQNDPPGERHALGAWRPQRRTLLRQGLAGAAGGLVPGWLALPSTAAAEAGTTGLAAAERRRIDAQLAAWVHDRQQPLAGLSVLVLRRGRWVYEAQFGRRWIDPHQAGRDLPMTRDTLLRVASVTKLLVALAALRLVEAGRLDLDADIGDYLGWRLRHPAHPDRPLSVRLLLSHRSGLRDDEGAFLLPGQTLRSRLLPDGAHYGAGRCWSAPAQAPGEWFAYCNLNSAVLASVLELAAGQRFDQLMAQQVLQPLGLEGAFDASQLSEAQIGQLATLYRKRETADEAPWRPEGPWVVQSDDFGGRRPEPPAGLDGYVLGSNGSLFGPQGRWRTRVADLGRVLAMLADAGRHEGRAFLQASSVRLLMSEHWRFDRDTPNGDDADGLFQAWGLGLQHFIDRQWRDPATGRPRGDRLRRGGGQRAWGHLGEAYGLHAGLMLDPQTRSGIVYAISGTGADPALHPGAHSSFPAWEERIVDALWQLAR